VRPARALIVAAALLLAAAHAARADAPRCSATSPGLNFGAYDTTRAVPTDFDATLTVSCSILRPAPPSASVSYVVSFSAGTSGTAAQRRMLNGTAFLNYNLFTDVGRTLVLGDGTGGTQQFSGSMTLGPSLSARTKTATYPVRGRLYPRQDVPPGTYVDTLVVTITF